MASRWPGCLRARDRSRDTDWPSGGELATSVTAGSHERNCRDRPDSLNELLGEVLPGLVKGCPQARHRARPRERMGGVLDLLARSSHCLDFGQHIGQRSGGGITAYDRLTPRIGSTQGNDGGCGEEDAGGHQRDTEA